MSFLLPDPGELRALAGRITAAADGARSHADRLGRAVAAAGWHGPAARVFAGQAELALGGLRTSAGRLDDAAATLRRHADHVEDVVHLALELVRAGMGPLPQLLAHPEDILRPMSVGLRGLGTVAGGAISTVGDLAGDALDAVGLG
jgi:uncharacterized protein YukE